MCKTAVKKSLFAIVHAFSISKFLKWWNLFKKLEKVIDYYPHPLQEVSGYYMTQEMCEQAVDVCHSILMNISNCYKTQKTCGKNSYFSFYVTLCLWYL